MGGFQKLLVKHLFNFGSFFQLTWQNPYYLDRTGAAIVETKNRLENWVGDIYGFKFNDIDNTYTGIVSMDKYWIRLKNQNYYDLETILSLSKAIKKDVTNFFDVYDIQKVKRIGFRYQGIYDKYENNSLKKFQSLLNNSFENLAKNYEFDNQKLQILLNKKSLKINISISFATKNSITNDGPDKGFLIDMDFYKEINNENKKLKDSTIDELEFIFDFFRNNYEDIISEIFLSLGISK